MGLATGALIGSAIAGIGGSVIGSLASASDREKAQKAMQEAYDMLKNTPMPPDLSKRLVIERLKDAGVWKPEMEQAIDVGVSKVSEIQESPEFRQKQLATLAGLEEISKTGMSATARAEMNRLRMQAGRDEQARRQSLMQQMQARGLAGGGAELAAQLASQQGAATQEAEAADRLAAQQEQAKLSALTQMGGMAGQIRGQEFDIARTKAEAADQFKKFDISARRDIEQRRAAQETAARQYAIQNQQRLADINTQMANMETQRQAQAQRQYWEDQLSRNRMIAGAQMGQGQMYQQQAQGTQQSWGQIGGAVAGGLSALGQYGMGAGLRAAQTRAADATADYYNRSNPLPLSETMEPAKYAQYRNDSSALDAANKDEMERQRMSDWSRSERENVLGR